MSNGETGFSKVWNFVPPVVGWLVAALIAWGLMGTRVAVLESQAQENSRRVTQLETDLRHLTSQLQEIQRSVYEVNATVQRVEAKVSRR